MNFSRRLANGTLAAIVPGREAGSTYDSATLPDLPIFKGENPLLGGDF
jgi:hypothetical protein